MTPGISGLLDERRHPKGWRREQAPGLDGDWLTAASADERVLAIAPPGVALGPRTESDTVRWRVAWWPADIAADNLLSVPPSHLSTVPLADLLAAMPRRIAAWAVATHRAAHREQVAAAARARTRGKHAQAALATSRAEALAVELREALQEEPPGARRPAREPSRAGRPKLPVTQ